MADEADKLPEHVPNFQKRWGGHPGQAGSPPECGIKVPNRVILKELSTAI